MNVTAPQLQWSESTPSVAIQTSDELDKLLDKIATNCQPNHPISVRLEAHGFKADILLGLPESFVYLDEVNPTRYFVTMGDSSVEGVLGFYFLEQHHTEFERRHLIPAATARRVLREFYETGLRSTCVEWEEGQY
jgi:hypothetical protein